MEAKVTCIRSVLNGLFEEIERVSEEIKTSGIVQKEMCQLCRELDKRVIFEFSPEERKSLEQLNKWLKETQILAIDNMFFKTAKAIKGVRAVQKDENEYVYALPNVHDTASANSKMFSSYPKLKTFLFKFKTVKTCPHFGQKPENILGIEYQNRYDAVIVHTTDYGEPVLLPSSFAKKKKSRLLYLCCDDCKKRFENAMCDNVKKRDFSFAFDCSLKDILLRKRLNENGLPYEDFTVDSEKDSDSFTEPYEMGVLYNRGWMGDNFIFYLKEKSIMILGSDYGYRTKFDERLKDAVKFAKPELIVAMDDKSNLARYLELGTSIFVYNKDGSAFYNKNRTQEQDLKIICEKIEHDLNTFVEKERGKEHDRIISALSSIGQELGYVTQREYSVVGIRIDCVWLDKNGKIQVAIEVETSSTWKKDLISTWEVEPRLAIIVGSSKTDHISQSLMASSLMKAIHHYVLYINKQTDHCFLYDKQEIIKYFKLKEG